MLPERVRTFIRTPRSSIHLRRWSRSYMRGSMGLPGMRVVRPAASTSLMYGSGDQWAWMSIEPRLPCAHALLLKALIAAAMAPILMNSRRPPEGERRINSASSMTLTPGMLSRRCSFLPLGNKPPDLADAPVGRRHVDAVSIALKGDQLCCRHPLLHRLDFRFLGDRALRSREDQGRRLDLRETRPDVACGDRFVHCDRAMFRGSIHLLDIPFAQRCGGFGRVDPIGQRLSAPAAHAVLIERGRAGGFAQRVGRSDVRRAPERRIAQGQGRKAVGMLERGGHADDSP